MPVVKAKGEAEALCAQLDSEGYVDACITADSDAFLFGATCVIKCVRPNSKVSTSALVGFVPLLSIKFNFEFPSNYFFIWKLHLCIICSSRILCAPIS